MVIGSKVVVVGGGGKKRLLVVHDGETKLMPHLSAV